MNIKILILCTGNSCRSQMAHGFLKNMLPEATVFSAGLETHGVNPRAIQVMSEIGIDISTHTSDLVDTYVGHDFTHIITVCDHAAENCPIIPAQAFRIHKSFPDPAKVKGTEEVILTAFRSTRDLIQDFCVKLSEDLLNK